MVSYEGTSTSREDQDFLGYCELHSKTPRALFSIEDINRLRELRGYKPFDPSWAITPDFAAVHWDEMREALESIRERYMGVSELDSL